MASDIISGGLTGAGIGTEIAPGIGTLIGAGIGMIAGGFEDSAKKKREAANPLPLTDPYQIQMLNDLKRKQKSLETGAAYQPQQDLIKQAGNKAMDNIVKISGGNVGTAVASLNAAQRATGKNMNELFGEMSAESFKMEELMNDLTTKISNRQLEIQKYQKSQAETTAANKQQNTMQGLMGFAAGDKGNQFGNYLKGLLSSNSSSDSSLLQSAGNEYFQSALSNIPVD